jgi:hypothetical protein
MNRDLAIRIKFVGMLGYRAVVRCSVFACSSISELRQTDPHTHDRFQPVTIDRIKTVLHTSSLLAYCRILAALKCTNGRRVTCCGVTPTLILLLASLPEVPGIAFSLLKVSFM